jgi:hypothetical protein
MGDDAGGRAPVVDVVTADQVDPVDGVIAGEEPLAS